MDGLISKEEERQLERGGERRRGGERGREGMVGGRKRGEKKKRVGRTTTVLGLCKASLNRLTSAKEKSA